MPERIGHRTLTKYGCKKRSRTRERVQRYAKGTPSTTHNEAPTPGISTQRVSAAPNQQQTNRGWNAPAHDTDEGSKSISTPPRASSSVSTRIIGGQRKMATNKVRSRTCRPCRSRQPHHEFAEETKGSASAESFEPRVLMFIRKSLNFTNFSGVIGLVRKSAALSSVRTRGTMISSASTISRT